MGWLIVLTVLILLGCLPLGVSGKYDVAGPSVKLLIGPAGIGLFPKAKKEKPIKEKPKEKKAVVQNAAKTAEKKGGNLADFLPLLEILGKFLNDFRRKLRIKRLELLLCMAGGDPCNLAINYGRAWAAVGNLMPQLERLFVIKKRDVQVQCDFTQSQTTVYVRADITITLGRLLGLLIRYGWLALKEYLKMSDKRKGGALK